MAISPLNKQPSVKDHETGHSHLDRAKIAMSKLIEGRRVSSTKIALVIDDVSEKINVITNELDNERKLRSSFERQSQDLSVKLDDIQRKYAELHEGFVKVLTSKFPGESSLSIKTRMESILLATNTGSDLGKKPDLVSHQATTFLNLIEDSLT